MKNIVRPQIVRLKERGFLQIFFWNLGWDLGKKQTEETNARHPVITL